MVNVFKLIKCSIFKYFLKMSLHRSKFFQYKSQHQSRRRFGAVLHSSFELPPAARRLPVKSFQESPPPTNNTAIADLLPTGASKALAVGEIRKKGKRNIVQVESSVEKSDKEEFPAVSEGKKRKKKELDIFDDEELDSD